MSDSAVFPLFLFAAARACRASEPRFGTARRGGGLATSIAVGIPVTPKPCRSSLFRRGIGDRIAAESEGGGACGSLEDASSTNPAAFARGDDVAGEGDVDDVRLSAGCTYIACRGDPCDGERASDRDENEPIAP